MKSEFNRIAQFRLTLPAIDFWELCTVINRDSLILYYFPAFRNIAWLCFCWFLVHVLDWKTNKTQFNRPKRSESSTEYVFKKICFQWVPMLYWKFIYKYAFKNVCMLPQRWKYLYAQSSNLFAPDRFWITLSTAEYFMYLISKTFLCQKLQKCRPKNILNVHFMSTIHRYLVIKYFENQIYKLFDSSLFQLNLPDGSKRYEVPVHIILFKLG